MIKVLYKDNTKHIVTFDNDVEALEFCEKNQNKKDIIYAFKYFGFDLDFHTWDDIYRFLKEN